MKQVVFSFFLFCLCASFAEVQASSKYRLHIPKKKKTGLCIDPFLKLTDWTLSASKRKSYPASFRKKWREYKESNSYNQAALYLLQTMVKKGSKKGLRLPQKYRSLARGYRIALERHKVIDVINHESLLHLIEKGEYTKEWKRLRKSRLFNLDLPRHFSFSKNKMHALYDFIIDFFSSFPGTYFYRFQYLVIAHWYYGENLHAFMRKLPAHFEKIGGDPNDEFFQEVLARHFSDYDLIMERIRHHQHGAHWRPLVLLSLPYLVYVLNQWSGHGLDQYEFVITFEPTDPQGSEGLNKEEWFVGLLTFLQALVEQHKNLVEKEGLDDSDVKTLHRTLKWMEWFLYAYLEELYQAIMNNSEHLQREEER